MNFTFKTEIESQAVQNKCMVTKAEGRGKGKIKGLGLTYTHCYISNR